MFISIVEITIKLIAFGVGLGSVASFRANSQTTPNLNVPTNRRFPTTGFEPQEVDMKTVNALATLRRQERQNLFEIVSFDLLGFGVDVDTANVFASCHTKE